MGLLRRVTAALNTVPLRTRLVGILLVSLVTALALTGYGVQRVLGDYLIEQVDEKLAPSADYIAKDRDLGILNSLANAPSLRVQVSVDGQGSRTYGGPQQGGDSTPLFAPLSSQDAARLQGKRSYSQTYTLHAANGSVWRAVSFRPALAFALPGSDVVGPTSVTVAESLNDVQHALTRLRLLIAWVGAAATLGCVLLGWLAIRRAFRPLREVERTAAAIAAGDLSQRVPDRPATTEVGRLTSSLNIMLSRIESAFRAREASEQRTRRFAADASHELRTPLASIRGFAELYRQGAVPPDEVPRTMRRIEDEATRMGGLVEDLLLLARLDEQRSVRSDPVDLAVLANDALHDARGLDSDRRLRLTGLDSGGPVPAVVIGDEDRLRQVVANLMANAIRHTPAGSPVEVAVGTRAGTDAAAGPMAVLEVRDHGAGLSEEQAAKIFERFYRVDPSRQRGRGGGSGLGLSIVAAVVSAHNGQVGVRPTPGGGATFTVTLPVAPANISAVTADV